MARHVTAPRQLFLPGMKLSKASRGRKGLKEYSNSGYEDRDGDDDGRDDDDEDEEDDDDGDGGVMPATVVKKLRRNSGEGHMDGFASYGLEGGSGSKAGPSGQFGEIDSLYFLRNRGHWFLSDSKLIPAMENVESSLSESISI